MNQLELQKATEDLISQRNRLNAEAPPSAPEKSAISSGPEGKTASSPAKKTPPKTVRRSVPPQQAAAAPPATTASTQGAGEAAGADPKP